MGNGALAAKCSTIRQLVTNFVYSLVLCRQCSGGADDINEDGETQNNYLKDAKTPRRAERKLQVQVIILNVTMSKHFHTEAARLVLVKVRFGKNVRANQRQRDRGKKMGIGTSTLQIVN